jgi:hypothetical protein
MKRFLMTAAAVAVTGVAADARPRVFQRVFGGRGQPAPAQSTVTATAAAAGPSTATVTASSGGGLAQAKAETQARAGRCFHPGGGLGGGTHEGCGFSSVSADDAVRHCCYWGRLPVREVGVARGPGGWYATAIYGQPQTGPVRTPAGGAFQTAGTLALPRATACGPNGCR